MINLGSLESLEVVNGSAVEIHYDLNYTQYSSAGILNYSKSGIISSSGTETILDVFDGTQSIHRLTIKNSGASTTAVQVQKNNSDGPIITEISKNYSLEANDLLEYESFYGFKEKVVNNVYVTTGSGSGGGISLHNLEGDANFAVVDYTVHEIQSGEFSADRTVDVSALTTECEIVNGEQSYKLTFTGATVYRSGGAITETECMSMATTHLRKVGSKIMIIN